MADECMSHSGDAQDARAAIVHRAEWDAARRVAASPRIDASEAKWVNHFGVALSKSGSSLGKEEPAADEHHIRDVGELKLSSGEVTPETSTSTEIGLNNEEQFDEPKSPSRSDGAELTAVVPNESCRSPAGQKSAPELLTGPMKGGLIQTHRRVVLLITLVVVVAAVGAFWRMGGSTLAAYLPSRTFVGLPQAIPSRSQSQASQKASDSEAGSVREPQADLGTSGKANDLIEAGPPDQHRPQQPADAVSNAASKEELIIAPPPYQSQEGTRGQEASPDKQALRAVDQPTQRSQRRRTAPKMKNGNDKGKANSGVGRIEPFFPFRY